MTDNVTNLLLAQRLMARLHPPETGGMPNREPPDWALTLEARLRQERERRLGEQTRWNYWQNRIREQQGWMNFFHPRESPPETSTFDRDWSSDLTQPPVPAWLTDAQQELKRRREQMRWPMQWQLSPPHYEIPQDFRPLNETVPPPIPDPTYPGQTLPPSPWPSYR